jgi:hypothetical protein
MALSSEDELVSKVFFNWNKGIEKLKIHLKLSEFITSHRYQIFMVFQQRRWRAVKVHHVDEKMTAHNAPKMIVTTLQYLAQ